MKTIGEKGEGALGDCDVCLDNLNSKHTKS